MIDELDVVALTRDLPAESLAAGDVGTVVHAYKDGQAYEVEFATLTGVTIGVVTLEAHSIRPVTEREIAHVRQVA